MAYNMFLQIHFFPKTLVLLVTSMGNAFTKIFSTQENSTRANETPIWLLTTAGPSKRDVPQAKYNRTSTKVTF
jgi:hypothetical protein